MTRFVSIAVCLLAMTTVAFVSACEKPDCENVDMGSCGTACCQLGYRFSAAAGNKPALQLEAVLRKGGPVSI
jgi:hypothetical protein